MGHSVGSSRDDPTSVWRFELQQLRDAAYWQHLHDGTTAWLPAVVLTDRKDRAVSNWPFSLAYEVFQRRLISSDHWLVIGYGLGDVPVNALGAAAVRERARIGRPRPKMLVIDRISDTFSMRKRVSDVWRIPVSDVTVSGTGLPEAFDSPEWMRWKAA